MPVTTPATAVMDKGMPMGVQTALDAVRDAPGIVEAIRLADDLAALRWRLSLGRRSSLRFSLWQRTPAGWQLRFHQGTTIPD